MLKLFKLNQKNDLYIEFRVLNFKRTDDKLSSADKIKISDDL